MKRKNSKALPLAERLSYLAELRKEVRRLKEELAEQPQEPAAIETPTAADDDHTPPAADELAALRSLFN